MSDLGPLIGTPSKISLFDEQGNLIVKEGEIITIGVIDRASDAGRLDDLVLATLAAEAEPEIERAGEYVEIGEEEPTGVHPE
jgi:hypothetical protein